MDHPAVIFRFISVWKRRQGMAFREVLVTQVREVLRAWLAGAGKRPAARRAGGGVKTAARDIHAAQAAGLVRDGDESQLADEVIGEGVGAVRPARPAGHGASWEALAPREAEITAWVKAGLALVKIGELLERSGTAVPYRTLARFAASECGYSSSRQQVTVPVADGKPGEEVQLDFGYLGMISDGDRRRRLHALVFTAVVSRYCFVFLTFSQTTAAVIAGCEAACSGCLSRTTSSRWWIRRTGWSRGGTGNGWSMRRPAAWSWTRPGSAPPKTRGGGETGWSSSRSASSPASSSPGSPTRSTGRRTGAASRPGCGCTAPPASGPRRCSRSWRRRRCCPRLPSRTGCRRGARRRCSATSTSGRRTRST